MRLPEREARHRFAAARVARLSTVRADARPHLVPVTFVLNGDAVLMTVDHKPKTGRELLRLRNIERNAAVSLLVDEYAEDWSALWWVRADGDARVLRAAAALAAPIDQLAMKYPQYVRDRPDGPVIRVDVRRWVGWKAR